MNAPVPTSPEKLEQRLQRIARTTADVVWEWDVAGDTVWWSPNFPLLFGHPFEEAPRTSGAWAEYLHPEDRARVVAELEAALAGPDELWGAEYRFRRADGSYADVFDRGHIERDAAGKALRVVGAMMDISERKAAEEALRESEARFRALVELSSDWYWEQDEELRFLPGRQSAQKDAFRAARYVGKTRWEVVGASLDDPAWAAHKALLERREPFEDFEYGRIGGDGVYRWVSISGEPVFDAAGRFRGYRGVGRDITARRQAEAEREKLARAYASLSAVNELVARAGSATELLQGACEIAVASGDFLFAVARRVERESATTRLVAFAGVGHPERLKRPLDLRPGSPDAQSLMVRAHQGGRPIVLAGDAIASNSPLGALVEESGVRAGAAYPLMRNDECIGGLLLCSRNPQAFAGESGALFERMATNLSFGLEALEAAEALRRKDAYFRSLVENLSDAIGATDMDWRYLYAGPSVERILGFKPEELVGRRFGDATAPEKAEAMRRDLAARLERTGEPQIARFEARYKDGGLRIHEAVVSKGIGPEGQPIYVIAGRDVTDRVRAEETLRRFRLALDRSGELIAIIDLETMRYVDANDPLCAALGYSREELLGMHPDEVIPVGRDELRATYERLTRGEDVPAIRSYYRCKDGSRFPYESRRHAVQSADGRWLIVSIARDMRAELAAEEELFKRAEEFRAVAENAPDGIMRFDAGLRCLYANAAIGKTSARPAEWYLGRRLGEFGLPPGVERALGDAVRAALSSGETQTLEFVFAGPRGDRHYQARLAPERGPDGRPVSVLGISRDMTDRKQFESRIEHLATHDGLTGLPNRALLGDRVEQAIVHAKRSQGALALLFVDLDQFKLVNDSFGHGAGDALLVEVAGRLRETVREGDTVARLGGDEFVILLTSLTRAGDSALVARKVAEALDRPVALGNGELRVTASIGISLYPDDGDNLDALLQSADAAMYRAKDSGRNSFQYYSAEMGEQARSRVEIEGGLRRALERGELRLHYQPQVDLATGAVNAVEALLRWEHPQRGMVSPAAFIPVAEESGLIVPIGQWVLSEACREAAGWAAAGLDVKVAVNLSARQFWRGSVTEAVRTALAEAGLPAARLELEITESVVARDLQQVMLALEQLRRMGVGIAIDDFGTGYSSLAYLRSLPIKKVKIDKSFIHGIPADREATALVAEIVRLAHVLSLGVVAEGVETPEQARQLRDAGCEAMQGFLFARPMPAPDIAALLRSGRRFVHGA